MQFFGDFNYCSRLARTNYFKCYRSSRIDSYKRERLQHHPRARYLLVDLVVVGTSIHNIL